MESERSQSRAASSRERHARVREVFVAALEIEPAQRERWLVETCSGDEELRREVASLLDSEPLGERLLDRPVLGGRLPLTGFLGRNDPHSALAGNAEMPERIGRYRVRGLIGQGGMGVVYLAEQDHPARTVALKLLRSDSFSPARQRRFELEAEILGRLQHRGIAQVHDAGIADTEAGPRSFLAMEFVQGAPLLEFARELPLRRKLELLRELCEGVQHAHQHGVIHRDLKPANVLVDRTGQTKIVDFGVARAEFDASTVATLPGELVGTLPYMSPEQVSGAANAVDTRSDVYALGMIGFELLAGRLPYDFDDKSWPEIARTIREDAPLRLGAIEPRSRGDVETILAKALEKDRERRYGSAAELGADLERHLRDEPIAARRPSVGYQLAKFARRNRGLVAGLSATFVALIGGTIVSTVFAVRAGEAAEDAELHLTNLRAEARKKDAVNQVFAEILDSARIEELGRDATLRDALEAAEQRIPEAFGDAPELEAPVRLMLGRAWNSLGEIAVSRPQFERARQLYEQLDGVEPAELTELDDNYAGLLYNEGKIAEAALLIERTLEARRRLLGPEDPKTLATFRSLVTIWITLERYDEADRYIDELRTIALRQHGEDSTESLEVERLRATYLESRRDYARLVPHARAMYATAQRLLEPDDPDLVQARNMLVVALVESGELAEALPLAELNRSEFERVFSRDHASTLAPIDALGMILRGLGRLPEAEAVFREALERAHRVCTEDDPNAATICDHLAGVLQAQQRLEEAEPLLREAHERRTASLGRGHEQTLVHLVNHANVLRQLGRFEEAAALARAGLETAVRARGAEDQMALQCAYLVGLACLDEGKPKEALPYFERALAGLRRFHQPSDPWLLNLASWAGLAAMDAGEPARAAEILEELRTTHVELFGESDARTLFLTARLGAARIQTRELEAAEAHLRAAVDANEQLGLTEGVHWVYARELLGVCLLRKGELGEAQALLLDSHELRQQLHPPGDLARRNCLSFLVELNEARGDADGTARYRELLAAETAAAAPGVVRH